MGMCSFVMRVFFCGDLKLDIGVVLVVCLIDVLNDFMLLMKKRILL